jgi:3-mercaptopyruvate sulfurtransferase SseA
MQKLRYNRGHFPGSINMPSNQTFSEDNELVVCDSATTLQASKGKIVIVLGGRANNCPKV